MSEIEKWLDELGPAIPTRRPTIAELEAILSRDDEEPIEILPNGEVRAATGTRPLTFRDNLGGEYGLREAQP